MFRGFGVDVESRLGVRSLKIARLRTRFHGDFALEPELGGCCRLALSFLRGMHEESRSYLGPSYFGYAKTSGFPSLVFGRKTVSFALTMTNAAFPYCYRSTRLCFSIRTSAVCIDKHSLNLRLSRAPTTKGAKRGSVSPRKRLEESLRRLG